MLIRSTSSRRRATSLVEAALTYSVVILLTIGVIVVSLGVYYYNQVASLAREGARYASVHGGQYAAETGNTMATQLSVYNSAIQPKAIGFDTTQLNATVTWTDSGEMPTYVNSSGNVVTNQVTVTVSYQWQPLLFLGTMTLQSTSVMLMQY